MTELASGGFIVPATDAKRIEKALGEPLLDMTRLVSVVERGMDKEGDHSLVELKLDPTYLPSITQTAQLSGRTVKALIRDVAARTMKNMFYINPEPAPVQMTQSDYRAISEIISVEDPNGTDIANWIKDKALEAVPSKR
jgi:hypothetical protein